MYQVNMKLPPTATLVHCLPKPCSNLLETYLYCRSFNLITFSPFLSNLGPKSLSFSWPELSTPSVEFIHSHNLHLPFSIFSDIKPKQPSWVLNLFNVLLLHIHSKISKTYETHTPKSEFVLTLKTILALYSFPPHYS